MATLFAHVFERFFFGEKAKTEESFQDCSDRRQAATNYCASEISHEISRAAIADGAGVLEVRALEPCRIIHKTNFGDGFTLGEMHLAKIGLINGLIAFSCSERSAFPRPILLPR